MKICLGKNRDKIETNLMKLFFTVALANKESYAASYEGFLPLEPKVADLQTDLQTGPERPFKCFD